MSEILEFWITVVVAIFLMICGLTLIVYVGEFYKFFPGWGPISKYDADKSDELYVRQSLVARKPVTTQKATDNIAWEARPGQQAYHPQYGFVTIRDDFKAVLEARKGDITAPRDEPTMKTHTAGPRSDELYHAVV